MGITCKPMGELGRMLAKADREKQKEAAAKRQAKANKGKDKGGKSNDKKADK